MVGDTTTTMMWIDGVSPLQVFEAYVAALVAMVIFGIPASFQQHRYSPITADPGTQVSIDWARVEAIAHDPRGLALAVTQKDQTDAVVIAAAPRVDNRVPAGANWDGADDPALQARTEVQYMVVDQRQAPRG